MYKKWLKEADFCPQIPPLRLPINTDKPLPKAKIPLILLKSVFIGVHLCTKNNSELRFLAVACHVEAEGKALPVRIVLFMSLPVRVRNAAQ